MTTSPLKNARSSFGFDMTKSVHNDTYPTIDPTKADLSGKHVLITGASKGLGRANAVSYARAGAGAIVLVARSSLSTTETAVKQGAKEAGRPEPKVLLLQVDVIDRSSVDTAAEKVKAEIGHIDILVNNAGTLETWKPLHESDPDEWWNTWEVNIKGLYLVSRAFTPLVRASPSPFKYIVNVSSVGAHRKGAGASAYQTTKFALLRLTEFMQQENSDKGVITFVVHPGSYASELALKMPDYMHQVLKDTPELCGDTLVFLTKEERSWLGGRYVSTAWDMDEFVSMKKEIVDNDLLMTRMDVGFHH